MCPLIKLLPVRETLSCTADILANTTIANSIVLLQEVLSKFQAKELHYMYPKLLIKFYLKKMAFYTVSMQGLASSLATAFCHCCEKLFSHTPSSLETIAHRRTFICAHIKKLRTHVPVESADVSGPTLQTVFQNF